ncbi:putative Ulp1 protease family catalytic domain, papain-like cysteine peptidase superfamily [Helianthus annuus]|nr:putative Ulp1 protease family catalytic domain, papain-like cysteine peptidase superfamily [Helianthus annuus]KAJ0646587.1 putative Ulp1 protease family catalytic domain, papain-like cysteine peptidase superfamily [Helianthus annuus]KAJ0823307.1 putative Ulp1 protease family catalytic domain, papain-like cysteine peptidase superfamily [Helianthus annuus]
MQTLSLNEKKEKMIEELTENIQKILQGAKLKNINDFKIILFPILHVEHFYVISFNLEYKQIFIIDNSAKTVTNKQQYGDVPLKIRNALAGYLKSVGHKNADDIKGIKPVRMEMKRRTKDNDSDCGIFCMRHMECYNGEEVEKWDCGFHEEYEEPAIIDKGKTHVSKQKAQLEDLRRKFITKILLHDINERKDFVIEDSKKFRNLSAKL